MIRVELVARDDAEAALWSEALDLATALPGRGWTLIGAQMVLLHCLEHGIPLGRTSGDLDLLVDVRLAANATRALADQLIGLGFAPIVTIDGRGHRFGRDRMIVDLLAPDGVGRRTSLETVQSARTIEVPGGSQALLRTELVEVTFGERIARLPRPNLLGAILLKARAVSVADDPAKHRSDLALLLSLVPDPRAMRAAFRGREPTWLAARAELLDPAHPAWRGVRGAENGIAALEILLGS